IVISAMSSRLSARACRPWARYPSSFDRRMRTLRSLVERRTVQLYLKRQGAGTREPGNGGVDMDGGNDERAAFREAMLGVTPLKRQNRVPPARPRPAARARFRRAARMTVLEDSLRGELIEQAGGEI